MYTETHARVAALCEAHDVEQSGDIMGRLAAVAGKVGAVVNPNVHTPDEALAAIDAVAAVEAAPADVEPGEGDGASDVRPFGPFGTGGGQS